MRSSDRSCPAEKARPSPVRTTQRTVSSVSAAVSASRSSACITPVKALSLSGRASVIVATPSTLEVWIAVNVISSSLPALGRETNTSIAQGAQGCFPPTVAHFGSPLPWPGGGPLCTCGGGGGGGGSAL